MRLKKETIVKWSLINTMMVLYSIGSLENVKRKTERFLKQLSTDIPCNFISSSEEDQASTQKTK